MVLLGDSSNRSVDRRGGGVVVIFVFGFGDCVEVYSVNIYAVMD